MTSLHCHAARSLQAPSYLGPVKVDGESAQYFLCTVCDAGSTIVSTLVTSDSRQRTCVTDWLEGQQLSTDEASCICWSSDPWPAEDFPEVEPRSRRYFHYRAIAKKLGAKGSKTRVKLPKCVQKRIADMYGDETGAPTKVGYKPA